MTQEKLPELVALIKEYGFENNVMLISSDANLRQAIATALPQSTIGVWRYSMNDKLIEQMASLTSAGKFIYIGKEGGEEGKASISLENYMKCKEKGVDIGYTYIASNEKSLFDEIVDNMIVRKNKTQYLMVLQCNGVNYDLMSEQEKISVEEGFVQFLNTLRFPIQLYVQSRTLNLRDIIEEYKARVDNLTVEIDKIDAKIAQAKMNGNKALKEKLEFEKRNG